MAQYQEQSAPQQQTFPEDDASESDLHVSENVAKDIESFSQKHDQGNTSLFEKRKRRRSSVSTARRLAIVLGVVAVLFSASLVFAGVSYSQQVDNYEYYDPMIEEPYWDDYTETAQMEDLSIAQFMFGEQLVNLPDYLGTIRSQGFDLRSNNTINSLEPGETVSIEVKKTEDYYGGGPITLTLVNPTENVVGIDDAVVIGYKVTHNNTDFYLPQWISINEDYYSLMDRLSDTTGKWVMEGSMDDATLTVTFPPEQEGYDSWQLTFDLLNGNVQSISGQFVPASQ